MEDKDEQQNKDISVPPELKKKFLLYTEELKNRGHLMNLIAFRMVETPKGLQYEDFWEGDNFEDLCEELDTSPKETNLEEKIILFKSFQEVDPKGRVVKFGYRTEKCFGCDKEMEILLPVRPNILTQGLAPA